MASASQNRTFLVVGWPMLDVIVKAPHLPGHSNAVTAQFQRAPGGSATNVATNLHRMGLPTHLVGVAGRDDAGDSVRQALSREGLRTSLAKRGYTPEVLCLVTEDGEPMRFSNLTNTVSLGLADINTAWADECRALHFEGWQLDDPITRRAWSQLASHARSAGAVVSLDLPHPHYIQRMGVPSSHRALKQIGIDVLFANHIEADAAELWNANDLASTIVIHSGDEATRVIQNGMVSEYPIEAVATPIDATGAGDAFASGFIAAYANRPSLDSAIQAAHAAGLSAVQSYGAALSLSDASNLWASLSKSEQSHARAAFIEPALVQDGLI